MPPLASAERLIEVVDLFDRQALTTGTGRYGITGAGEGNGAGCGLIEYGDGREGGMGYGAQTATGERLEVTGTGAGDLPMSSRASKKNAIRPRDEKNPGWGSGSYGRSFDKNAGKDADGNGCGDYGSDNTRGKGVGVPDGKAKLSKDERELLNLGLTMETMHPRTIPWSERVWLGDDWDGRNETEDE